MMRRLLTLAALSCWLALPVAAQPHDDHHGEEVAHEEAHADHADEHGDHHGHGDAFAALSLGEKFGALTNDKKFIASVISFSILMLILIGVGRRRVRAALENRRREIEEAVEEARRREEEAEAKQKEFEVRLAQLDSEMEKIREEVVRAGETERDRIVEDAEAKAALMRKDAKFQIEQQMKQLREDLTREAVEAAVTAAAGILTEKTTSTDQQRLAQSYLEQVAATAKEKRA